MKLYLKKFSDAFLFVLIYFLVAYLLLLYKPLL
jgi:hypothetical protein